MKLVVLFIMLSCSQLFAQDIEQYLESFEKSVLENNTNAILELIDKDYKSEQLSFLNGREAQFINELFCGSNEKAGFRCVAFDDIKDLEKKLVESTDGGYNIVYIVKTDEFSIECDWFIRRSNDEQGSTLGLVGAVG
ncbi:MAG: hypothetical protein MRY83_19340 [Flavobacteriales bacterium]|nr:hypothetical protein [Flavobacteriales bacterium]